MTSNPPPRLRLVPDLRSGPEDADDPALFDPQPFDQASVESAPDDHRSIDEMPADQASDDHQPIDELPVETMPADHRPIDEMPDETMPADPVSRRRFGGFGAPLAADGPEELFELLAGCIRGTAVDWEPAALDRLESGLLDRFGRDLGETPEAAVARLVILARNPTAA